MEKKYSYGAKIEDFRRNGDRSKFALSVVLRNKEGFKVSLNTDSLDSYWIKGRGTHNEINDVINQIVDAYHIRGNWSFDSKSRIAGDRIENNKIVPERKFTPKKFTRFDVGNVATPTATSSRGAGSTMESGT
jgi:hypothetical protein